VHKVYALNNALRNAGKTVAYRKLTDTSPSNTQDLKKLKSQMNQGKISTLIMLGGNPVYNAPSDFNFAESLSKVKNSIHLSRLIDETSKASTWQLPQSHFLEAWGDVRSSNGSVSLTQPLIAPLYATKSSVEILDMVLSGEEQSGYDTVRETWKGIIGGLNFEQNWREVLHDGILQNSNQPTSTPSPQSASIAASLRKNPLTSTKSDGLEITFAPSASTFDGRYANNGWLHFSITPLKRTLTSGLLPNF